MAIRGDEKYVEIEGTLVRKTRAAIRIKTDLAEGWVPRSCVHFATDKMVDDMGDDEDAQFKIMRWVAEERGFV